jgi:hypothetical protein
MEALNDLIFLALDHFASALNDQISDFLRL